MERGAKFKSFLFEFLYSKCICCCCCCCCCCYDYVAIEIGGKMKINESGGEFESEWVGNRKGRKKRLSFCLINESQIWNWHPIGNNWIMAPNSNHSIFNAMSLPYYFIDYWYITLTFILVSFELDYLKYHQLKWSVELSHVQWLIHDNGYEFLMKYI